jgi:hypothetical protein
MSRIECLMLLNLFMRRHRYRFRFDFAVCVCAICVRGRCLWQLGQEAWRGLGIDSGVSDVAGAPASKSSVDVDMRDAVDAYEQYAAGEDIQ